MVTFLSYPTLMILSVLMSSSAGGNNPADTRWIKDITKQANHSARNHQQEALQMIEQAEQGEAQAMRCPATKAIVEEGHKARQSALPFKLDEAGEARYPKLLVLVSLSMPLETLKALGAQLQKVGGKLVFRGLINNSFQDMARKLQELGTEALIDPTLFEALQVEAVPTFVHFSKSPDSADALPPFDLLKGNVSLHHSLTQFHEKGEVGGAGLLIQALEKNQ